MTKVGNAAALLSELAAGTDIQLRAWHTQGL
jgi:hypothetical protein